MKKILLLFMVIFIFAGCNNNSKKETEKEIIYENISVVEEDGYIYYNIYLDEWEDDLIFAYAQEALDMGTENGYSITNISIFGESSDKYNSFYNTANSLTLKEYSDALGWQEYEYKDILKY